MNRFFLKSIFALSLLSLLVVPYLAEASTSVSVESLSPASTVSVGTDVTFTLATTGFNAPSFAISDSFTNSTVSNGDIVSSVDANGNAVGAFNWTPTTADVGVHVLTISITDTSGNTGTAVETITVASGPTISLSSISPGYSLAINTPLTATIVSTSFTNPVYTAQDSISNSTLSSSDINSSGYFSWTPTTADIGNQTITFTVVDSYGHSASISEQITVKSPYVTVESLQPGQNVSAGSTVTFQIVPNGFINPWYDLQDSLYGSTLSNANINSSGYVSWTPTAGDEGTHSINVAANDSDSHNATDTITVYVGAGSGVVSNPPTPAPTSAAATTPPTTPSLLFTAYLALGSTGSQVTELQTLLSHSGYLTVSPTGYFGIATKAAVEKFQSDHGLSTVGAIGPQTRVLLNQLSTTPTSSPQTKFGYQFSVGLSVGSQGPAVSALQSRLVVEGVYSGPITGYFGSATEAAVKAYQTKHDLSAVGVLGPQTRAYLNEGI
jgi:peptidoglycan hydrolase-like protein with peptidoglycan-binding domain